MRGTQLLALLLIPLVPMLSAAQESYHYGAVFTITDEADADAILVFDELEKTIALLRWENGSLRKSASAPAPGRPTAAAPFREGGVQKIAVAFGEGRVFRNAPTKVVLYDLPLQQSRTIFEPPTERSQPVFLQPLNDGFVFVYFESKYMTRAGMLVPETGNWTFKEMFKARLGISNALLDEHTVLTGRPYRDEAAGTGELMLYRSGQGEELPSFRGVSSVAVVQTAESGPRQILIGDGWHQNYGKLAEPRLTLLTLDPATKRYAARVISTTTGQMNVSRILQLGQGPGSTIIAGGDKFIDCYFPGRDWQSIRAYSKSTGEYSANLDFTVFRSDGTPRLVVWDGEAKTVAIPTQPENAPVAAPSTASTPNGVLVEPK